MGNEQARLRQELEDVKRENQRLSEMQQRQLTHLEKLLEATSDREEKAAERKHQVFLVEKFLEALRIISQVNNPEIAAMLMSSVSRAMGNGSNALTGGSSLALKEF